jgi:hypothetical protein
MFYQGSELLGFARARGGPQSQAAVKNAGVELLPGKHLFIWQRLRNMIDSVEMI